jgi:hypothetical protein
MTNPRLSHRSQHPEGHVAAVDPAARQVPGVGTPSACPGTSPTGPPPAQGVAVEQGRPPLLQAEPTAAWTAHVSLLAATALGLAFASGASDGNVSTLIHLADNADILLQASTAVLLLEVAPRQTRAIAADLLGRAARTCA